jgi:hypothetical protein
VSEVEEAREEQRRLRKFSNAGGRGSSCRGSIHSSEFHVSTIGNHFQVLELMLVEMVLQVNPLRQTRAATRTC